MEKDPDKGLREHHRPERIRDRIRNQTGSSHLGDAVLGAIDGGITSFAVVAGAVGGQLSAQAVLVLGFASLIADGFSMAVSNYLSAKSQAERSSQLQRQERSHIEHVPEGQRRELEELLKHQGLSGEALQCAVEGITANRELWASTVVRDLYGATGEGGNPLRSGVTTMLAFVLVGSAPLLPFLVTAMAMQEAFVASITVTAAVFVMVGLAKGRVVGTGMWKAGMETLLVGGGAAVLAYSAGHAIRQLISATGMG